MSVLPRYHVIFAALRILVAVKAVEGAVNTANGLFDAAERIIRPSSPSMPINGVKKAYKDRYTFAPPSTRHFTAGSVVHFASAN